MFPVGDSPTGTTISGTEIVNCDAGDTIAFENADAACASGFTAGEISCPLGIGAAPYIVGIVGNEATMCLKSDPGTCETFNFGPPGGCATVGSDLNMTPDLLPVPGLVGA